MSDNKMNLYVYMDTDKVLSLYSQINGGVVQNVISEISNKKTDVENQKAVRGSGLKLAKELEEFDKKIASKHLHDHIYSQLEEDLIKMEKISYINDESKESIDFNEIKSLSFVKVKGKAKFIDYTVLQKFIKDFNVLGTAIGDLQFAEKKDYKSQKLKILKENNLNIDEKLLKNANHLLNYSFKDAFELEIEIDDKKFIAPLNRKFFKEDEAYFIKKLSRATEAKVTVLGIVTQTLKKEVIIHTEEINEESANMRDIAMTIIKPLLDVEEGFSGKSLNDIIIDPLAVYLELE